jgi:hypothetical protein
MDSSSGFVYQNENALINLPGFLSSREFSGLKNARQNLSGLIMLQYRQVIDLLFLASPLHCSLSGKLSDSEIGET